MFLRYKTRIIVENIYLQAAHSISMIKAKEFIVKNFRLATSSAMLKMKRYGVFYTLERKRA